MTEHDKQKITEYCIKSMQTSCIFIVILSMIFALFSYYLTHNGYVSFMIGFFISIGLIFYFSSYIKRNMWRLFSDLKGLNKIYWENHKH